VTAGHRPRPCAVSPNVSVVIPTHDRLNLLRRALASALAQRYVDLEVIVVDDGSSDGTAAFLEPPPDPRVRLLQNHPALGVAASRNRGIDEARGEWVAFLDDDDLWAPDKLRSQVDALERTGRRWCYVGHVNVDLRDRVTGGEPPLPPDRLVGALHESDVVPGGCSGVVAARGLLREAGGFDPSLQPLADWDLWLRLAAIEPPAAVARPLVAYRIQPASMSADADRVLAEFEFLAARHGEGNRATLYRYLGWWSLRGGNRGRAATFFLQAAIQRQSEYGLGDVVRELAYAAGDRLGGRNPIGRALLNLATPVERHRGWTAAGQAWIDALDGPREG
jgi:glycosyltransferase involved in cell wall biosynthesis